MRTWQKVWRRRNGFQRNTDEAWDSLRFARPGIGYSAADIYSSYVCTAFGFPECHLLQSAVGVAQEDIRFGLHLDFLAPNLFPS